MIELTIREMIESVSVLRGINDKKMPARTAYQFARIIREVENELRNFNVARDKALERYGKKDSAGKLIEDEDGRVEIYPEKQSDFNKEISDLMESKIKINCEPIELDDIADNEFTPNEIADLFLFIRN